MVRGFAGRVKPADGGESGVGIAEGTLLASDLLPTGPGVWQITSRRAGACARKEGIWDARRRTRCRNGEHR